MLSGNQMRRGINQIPVVDKLRMRTVEVIDLLPLSIIASLVATRHEKQCQKSFFMDGRPQTKDGKFFSAADVYGGEGSFTRIDAQTLTQGDVAAWGGHVEIVTSVNHANDEFCSRGGYREPMGGDKCNRKINDAKLRYFRVP